MKQSYTCKFINRHFKGLVIATDTPDGYVNVALISDPAINGNIEHPTGPNIEDNLRRVNELVRLFIGPEMLAQHERQQEIKRISKLGFFEALGEAARTYLLNQVK